MPKFVAYYLTRGAFLVEAESEKEAAEKVASTSRRTGAEEVEVLDGIEHTIVRFKTPGSEEKGDIHITNILATIK